jgi:hypothetical protein
VKGSSFFLITWSIKHWSLQVTYSRKTIEQPSDRLILEQAYAREIYRSWQSNYDSKFVLARLEQVEKIYGKGAQNRVRRYMQQMVKGELE